MIVANRYSFAYTSFIQATDNESSDEERDKKSSRGNGSGDDGSSNSNGHNGFYYSEDSEQSTEFSGDEDEESMEFSGDEDEGSNNDNAGPPHVSSEERVAILLREDSPKTYRSFRTTLEDRVVKTLARCQAQARGEKATDEFWVEAWKLWDTLFPSPFLGAKNNRRSGKRRGNRCEMTSVKMGDSLINH